MLQEEVTESAQVGLREGAERVRRGASLISGACAEWASEASADELLGFLAPIAIVEHFTIDPEDAEHELNVSEADEPVPGEVGAARSVAACAERREQDHEIIDGHASLSVNVDVCDQGRRPRG